MSFRLYESAWVRLAGSETPEQVRKDKANAAAFVIAGYQYDIDARPFPRSPEGPAIASLLNLQEVRELGLSSRYDG